MKMRNPSQDLARTTAENDEDILTTIMTTNERGPDASKYIGGVLIQYEKSIGDLVSSAQDVLRDILKFIGGTQVTIKRMECAPTWIIQKALHSEHDNNCQTANQVVSEKLLPLSSNTIGSHLVYKLKVYEKRQMKLK